MMPSMPKKRPTENPEAQTNVAGPCRRGFAEPRGPHFGKRRPDLVFGEARRPRVAIAIRSSARSLKHGRFLDVGLGVLRISCLVLAAASFSSVISRLSALVIHLDQACYGICLRLGPS